MERKNSGNGKFLNGNTLREVLSDEELLALLDEVPAVKRKEEKGRAPSTKEDITVSEGETSNIPKGLDKIPSSVISDYRFVNTYVLSLISEFTSSVSSLVNTTLELDLVNLSKKDVFSRQDLLLLKGEISFVNIAKASYPVFLLFPKDLFPLLVDSLLSNSKLSKYPHELVGKLINSAVDWDIVKFFWNHLFSVLEEVTTREFAKVKAIITGYENNSAEVVAYSLKHSLFWADINFKLHIWKFPVSLAIDYDFLEICDLLYQGILKEKVKGWKEILREKVMNSSVEVEARIFYPFTLRKLLSLKRGDVLSFSPEDVSLVINGEPKFRTKLGTVENNLLAVTIANDEKQEGEKQLKEVGSHESA